MPLKLNDDGIAFAFFMIVLFLVVATLIIVIMFGPMMNSFNGVVNSFVDDGSISAQTMSAVQWNQSAMGLTIIVSLIGAFLFAIVRSIYRKKMAGEGF